MIYSRCFNPILFSLFCETQQMLLHLIKLDVLYCQAVLTKFVLNSKSLLLDLTLWTQTTLVLLFLASMKNVRFENYCGRVLLCSLHLTTKIIIHFICKTNLGTFCLFHRRKKIIQVWNNMSRIGSHV